MFQVTDIHPLTDFTRSARSHIERLRETGRPEILTVNGKAAVVVQDAEAYQKLLELLDSAETVEAVQAWIESFGRDEGLPAREALEKLRAKHDIPRVDQSGSPS